MIYDNTSFWKKYTKRDDDIIIASTIKSGTTWLQQIITQIVFEGKYDGKITDISLWVDSQRMMDEYKILKIIDSQTHRRIFKTHSMSGDVCVDMNKKNRYVFITRDFRDVVWSWFNHIQNDPLKEINELFGEVNKANNEKELWDILMNTKHIFRSKSKKSITWAYFDTVSSWIKCKDMDNVLIIHYNNLKRDLSGCVNNIARFLGYDHNDQIIDEIVKRSTFDWMKNSAEKYAPASFINKGTHDTFINKGVNKRWNDALSGDDHKEYDDLLREFVDESYVNWVKYGVME
jgi:aryl sulfotransferase